MNPWPYQQECVAFYGNPVGKHGKENLIWKALNLRQVKPPFRMTYGGLPIRGIWIHRKCKSSLGRILNGIWLACGKNQRALDATGFTKFSGSYNPRLMRDSHSVSMHWFCCAIDFDAENHPMTKDYSPPFPKWIMDEFAKEGWVNLPRDRMHFQAALVHGLPVPNVPAAQLRPAATQPASKPISLMEINPMMDGHKTYLLGATGLGGIVTSFVGGGMPLQTALISGLGVLMLMAIRRGISTTIIKGIGTAATTVASIDSDPADDALLNAVSAAATKAVTDALAAAPIVVAAAPAKPAVVINTAPAKL